MRHSQRRSPARSPSFRVLSRRAAVEVALGLAVMLVALLAGPAVLRPWALAIPVALGLVHGFGAALWGALLALALGPLELGVHWLGSRAAGLDISLAWPLLALCAGELRDRLIERRDHAEANEHEARAALERLARAHETLRSSHAALETALGAEGWSLEASVRELERLARSGAEPRLQADALLSLCATHLGVTRAAVYLVAGGLPAAEPLACLGQTSRGSAGALALKAVEEGRLAFVGSAEGNTDGGVAALPLTDARGALLGVLVIDAVPFARLHRRELGLLRALGGRFADGLSGLVPQESPESPLTLRAESGVRTLSDSSASLPPLPASLARELRAPTQGTGSAVRRIPEAPGSGVHVTPIASGTHPTQTPPVHADAHKQAG